MPTKTSFTTREAIIHTPLPQHGGTYTVIPHSFIIDKAKDELKRNGFVIKHELYKSTQNGEIAQGLYHLNHQQDPDMGMMFAWSNSYDKSMRFKCAIGAHVFVCMNGVVSGSLANYSRKHTGTADEEAAAMIDYQIARAQMYFDQLIADKNLLNSQILSKRVQAELIGRLFFEEKIVTLTQMGIIKREIENPSFLYNSDKDSAWSLYNHVTHALKESHPSNYLDDHQRVHDLFVRHFNPQPVADPASLISIPMDFSKPEISETAQVTRKGRVVFV